MTNETKKPEQPKRVPAITVQPMRSDGEKMVDCPITEATVLRLATPTGQSLWADPMKLNPALTPILVLHGLKQKLIDAAAISRDPETGRSATVADKWGAVQTVWERLLTGEWNAARGDGTGSGGLLFKALCRMWPNKTPEAIREWLKGKSDKEQVALRGNPKVAAIIETIRAEQVKADDVDSDGLLDELDELGDGDEQDEQE